MLALNLPGFAPKVAEKDGKRMIFDPVRQKYVALTPEEWVRQHFVNYLITLKKFPKELLANEVLVKLNGTSKRCDTVVYNRFLEPLVIVEYKAPHINITNAVFDQIADVRVARKEPEQLADHAPQEDALRGQQREAFAEVEAHLVAEDAARARTRAVAAYDAFGADAGKQVEVLFHGRSNVSSRSPPAASSTA